MSKSEANVKRVLGSDCQVAGTGGIRRTNPGAARAGWNPEEDLGQRVRRLRAPYAQATYCLCDMRTTLLPRTAEECKDQ